VYGGRFDKYLIENVSCIISLTIKLPRMCDPLIHLRIENLAGRPLCAA